MLIRCPPEERPGRIESCSCLSSLVSEGITGRTNFVGADGYDRDEAITSYKTKEDPVCLSNNNLEANVTGTLWWPEIACIASDLMYGAVSRGTVSV